MRSDGRTRRETKKKNEKEWDKKPTTKLKPTKNQQPKHTHKHTPLLPPPPPPPRIFLIFKSSRYEAHQRHWNVVTENATVKSDINDYNLTLPVALTTVYKVVRSSLRTTQYLFTLAYLPHRFWVARRYWHEAWVMPSNVWSVDNFDFQLTFSPSVCTWTSKWEEEERERGDRQSGKHRQTDRQRDVGGRKGLSEVLTQRLSRISGWTENKTLFLAGGRKHSVTTADVNTVCLSYLNPT